MSHPVNFIKGGLLYSLTAETSWSVNSLHSQGIKTLSEQLIVEATADDGLIEAVSWLAKEDNRNWILGVQWHPEWQFESNKVSKIIFQAFGDAIRESLAFRSQ